jgi:PAS domain S-box-containing protein
MPADKQNSNLSLLKNLTEKLNLRDFEVIESEKRFRGFFENSSAGMCIANVNTGMFTEVNPVLCEWLGYTASELLSKPIVSFLAPEKTSETESVINKLQDGVVNKYLDKEGCFVWLKWDASIPNEKGINYSVCANVTRELEQEIEIKCLAKKQDELMKMYRNLTESSAEVICLHDANGKYIYMTPSFEKIFGHNRKGLIGKSPYDYICPDDIERVKKESHDSPLRKEENGLIRFRFKHADGDYIWVESSSQPILKDGEVVETRTNTRVISDVIEAEEMAAINREIYETILQDSRELIKVYKIKENGKPELTYVSPSCTEYTGYSPEEHVKQEVGELIHPDDVKKIIKDMLGIIEHKKRIVIRYRGKHKDTGFKLAESTLSPVLNENDDVTHIVLTSRLVYGDNNKK